MSEIDVVELKRALANMAELTRTFFVELVEQGFTEAQALTLTTSWLRATQGTASPE